MQLRELNGQLIAHTSAIDVIKGEYLEHLQEFLVSEEVSKDLQKYPNYLNPDYWYLVQAGRSNKTLTTELPFKRFG
jgi:hypothetical protein